MVLMDALTHILKTVQLSAKTYVCRGTAGPWNLQFQYRPQGIFHIVTQGQCYLRDAGNDQLLHLQAGDGVAFPTGGAHWISDSPDSQGLAAQNVVNVKGNEDLFLLKTGNVTAFAADSGPQENNFWETTTSDNDQSKNDQQTVLVSGTLSYDSSIDHPFLKSLPCFIQAGAGSSDDLDRLRVLTRLLVEESSGAYPGKPLMVDHLTEILFVQILRVSMGKMNQSTGYMAALADPHIGIALNLIHTEADQKWTVDSLCSASAMGRTSFNEKFVELVGITPKAYLTNTRLMKARHRLQNSNESTIAIAEDAGYASEAAFSRAIKRHFNKTPGELRKET